MKKLVLSLLLFVSFNLCLFSQTDATAPDSTMVPTGAVNDTVYFNAVFGFSNSTLKVQPARYIVESIMFGTRKQPIRDYWEIISRRKWARLPNGSTLLIWARKEDNVQPQTNK